MMLAVLLMPGYCHSFSLQVMQKTFPEALEIDNLGSRFKNIGHLESQ
uniref:Uncharacterized protein n=1 Tax=Anguilla anguilla TaxID=7936 RepID=A0A0E9SZN1_ANGAN